MVNRRTDRDNEAAQMALRDVRSDLDKLEKSQKEEAPSFIDERRLVDGDEEDDDEDVYEDEVFWEDEDEDESENEDIEPGADAKNIEGTKREDKDSQGHATAVQGAQLKEVKYLEDADSKISTTPEVSDVAATATEQEPETESQSSKQTDLDQHDTATHLEFECEDCDEVTFDTVDELIKHQLSEHAVIICYLCSLGCLSVEEFDTHWESKHPLHDQIQALQQIVQMANQATERAAQATEKLQREEAAVEVAHAKRMKEYRDSVLTEETAVEVAYAKRMKDHRDSVLAERAMLAERIRGLDSERVMLVELSRALDSVLADLKGSGQEQ